MSTQQPLPGVYASLSAYDTPDTLNVIIETPQGHRNKFRYDEKRGLFQLDGILSAGAVFPYDFGFIPATLGDDGDPLDVLVLLDEPVFTGCLVPARLLGGIEAEQEENSTSVRNDRLVAVSVKTHQYAKVDQLDGLNPTLLDEIEHFFRSYNAIKGKRFTALGRYGAAQAHQLVRAAIQARQQAQGAR